MTTEESFVNPSLRRKFFQQRYAAKRRGIAFLLSIGEWRRFWCLESRLARRGRGDDSLVMARFRDQGPYAVWNIACQTNRENLKQARAWARSKN